MTKWTRRQLLQSSAALPAATVLPAFAASPGNAPEHPPDPPTPLPRIVVHPEGHYLQTEHGAPFFWLGDTAWQLNQVATREECSYYLRTRARQGFSVIQVVVLSEFGGVESPTTLGQLPFANRDPRRPNDAYFNRIAEIVDEAASHGLYVALVPAWGDKLTAPWGTGPRLFRNDNLDDAHFFAHYLAASLKDRTNLLWLLGGDRPPRLKGLDNSYLQQMGKDAGFSSGQDWTPIWASIAQGLKDGGGRTPLVLYHPQGGRETSSWFLHNEPWLSANGMQSGHGGGHDVPVWDMVAHDYALSPPKPTIDLEPNYEDHPYNPWPVWDPTTGYFRDHDVRKQVYRSVLAGGCGVTYGHNSVWQFAGGAHPAIFHPDRDWQDALFRPAGSQMIFLRDLVLSRPYFRRIPDQSLIVGDAGSKGLHIQAARDREGTFAFIYFPMNDQSAAIDLTRLSGAQFRAWWYDPRTGIAQPLPAPIPRQVHTFQTPPNGPDWVLVIDSAESTYAPPGL